VFDLAKEDKQGEEGEGGSGDEDESEEEEVKKSGGMRETELIDDSEHVRATE